jgi:hypothetical protein
MHNLKNGIFSRTFFARSKEVFFQKTKRRKIFCQKARKIFKNGELWDSSVIVTS